MYRYCNYIKLYIYIYTYCNCSEFAILILAQPKQTSQGACSFFGTRVFVNIAAAVTHLLFVLMIRICKMSGQELPAVSTENICDIHDLKRELCRLHSFPVCLQQLLHKGNGLDDSSRLDALQDHNNLDDPAQPDLRDASVHLQLVLATASTAAELAETTQMFRDACQRRELETAQLLLNAGAEKDLRDDDETTALMEAAFHGHTEIVQLLLQAGAGKDWWDAQGRTPLMMAAGKGNMEIARLLLQAGADKDLQGQYGQTALIYAARTGNTEIAQLLLQAGAEKGLRDEQGRTALVWAACGSYTEIAHLLVNAGAEDDETTALMDL